jgi:spermidine synthase
LAAPIAAIAAAGFVLTPANVFEQTINTYHQPSKISFLKEHSTGTVTVHDFVNGDRLLAVDGVNVAGLDFMLRTTQKLQGYIPLCLHPNPKRVVQIGFGSGETARVGMEFGVPDYTVVEICPAIFDAGKEFEAINHGSYCDPRVRRVIMDAKNFAFLSRETFDIIMNDSVYPGSSGSSALYTIDHFRNCRQRLAPGGLFSCWVPLDLRPSELSMILKSFQEVFPNTSFWVASNCVNKHGLILGSLAPLQIDFARLKTLVNRPAIKADLAAIEIHDVYDFLDCHRCNQTALRKMVASTPINSDNRPRLEFSCANRAPSDVCLRQVLAMLTSFQSPIAPALVNLTEEKVDRAELARRFEATAHVFRAQVAQLAGLPKVRRNELDLALRVNPGEAHVRSCEEELRRDIRDLRRTLADWPNNRVFLQRLAIKLYLALRYEEAESLYMQLIQTSPPPADTAFVHLAEIQFNLGKVVRAETTLRRCLVAWPDSAEAHDRLAGICFRTGRFPEADYHIEQALRLDPDNPVYQQHKTEHRARKRGGG